MLDRLGLVVLTGEDHRNLSTHFFPTRTVSMGQLIHLQLSQSP